jgi:branched-chain amino acid transport system permease protein
MNSLPVQVVLLIVWLGLGAYGTYMLLQKGYRVNNLKILAYYVAPVVAILYLIINQIQSIDTAWPANLPGSIINIALGLILLIVSPALIIAAFLLPGQKGLDAPARALQRDTFVRIRTRVLLIGAIFLALVLPLLALSLFKTEAPAELRYDGVISVLINGLFSGALFALIALGYTLVYGIVELINFAHGDVFMMGSLVGFTVITIMLGAQSGRPVKTDTSIFLVMLAILLALIVSMTFCGLLNYLINRIAYKRLRNAPRLAPLISAIGVSFILQNIGLYLISSAPKGYPVLFPNSTRVANTDLVSDVLGNSNSLITIPVTGILVIVGVSVLLIALSYLINRTKIGKAMRAVAQNREAAALMGISIERTISFAFIIGGALAGAAGVIYGVYQVQGTVRYDLGFQNGLFAFTAAVLGGIGNVNGAVLGGLFIGLIYSLSQSSFFGLSASYVDLSIWAPVAVFGVLVLVMIFRPTGILGENVQEKV